DLQPNRSACPRQRRRKRTVSHRSHDNSDRRKHSAGTRRVLQLPLRRMGFTLTYLLSFVLLVLAQNPSLDSISPKERQAAIEQMAVIGNRDAIPKLAEAIKKEPKADIRAEMVAAL